MNRLLLLAALSGPLLAAPARAADDPGAEGVRLFLAGKKEAAVPLLREAVRRAPSDIRAHQNYQQALKNLDRWKELTEEYRQNISSHPLDGTAYYLSLIAVWNVDEIEADRVLDIGLKADPKNPHLTAAARLVASFELAGAGKTDEALALIGPATGYPFPADALEIQAQALDAAGRSDEAAELVRAVSKDLPLDPQPYMMLGDMASGRAKNAEAFELYQKAHRLRPSAETLNAMGRALELQGRRPEASKRYREASAASAVTLADELGRGFAAVGLADKEAVARAAAELEKRTKSAAWRVAAIQLKFLSSDSPENVAELKRLRGLYPDNQTLLNVDSTYRMSHGDCPGALPLFERLIKDNPTGFAAYQGKAYCDRTSGRPEEAIKTLAAGLAFLPKYYEFYRLQGETYAEMKEYDKAEKSYRRALELYPNDSYTSYSLCVALHAQKKEAAAAAACRVALKYAEDEDGRKRAKDGLCLALGSCVPPEAEREAAAKEIAEKYLPDASARFRAWKTEGAGYSSSAEALTAEAIAEHLEAVKRYPDMPADSPLVSALAGAKPGEIWAVTLRPDGKVGEDIWCLVDLRTNWVAELDENLNQR